jgi:signal transduction histidine kinase
LAPPPGTYTLEVKAANEDGVECQPITMQLHFLPKWYQTFLFKLSVALTIAGLLYILYAFRIRQLKKVFSVRQKISSDLHDDIGSTLSTINMYSQIAQLQPNQPGYANTIQENTQEVLEKLDDIVWATNPKNDQVQNLVERIDAFARPLLQAKKIQFIFNANDSIGQQKISTATRQNVFLICKEGINNIAKYAQCKTCTITVYTKGKYICCTITDDGIGFDTTQSTERNGLLNMQLRAKAVKGKFTITSSPGNGTEINMELPLS